MLHYFIARMVQAKKKPRLAGRGGWDVEEEEAEPRDRNGCHAPVRGRNLLYEHAGWMGAERPGGPELGDVTSGDERFAGKACIDRCSARRRRQEIRGDSERALSKARRAGAQDSGFYEPLGATRGRREKIESRISRYSDIIRSEYSAGTPGTPEC